MLDKQPKQWASHLFTSSKISILSNAVKAPISKLAGKFSTHVAKIPRAAFRSGRASSTVWVNGSKSTLRSNLNVATSYKEGMMRSFIDPARIWGTWWTAEYTMRSSGNSSLVVAAMPRKTWDESCKLRRIHLSGNCQLDLCRKSNSTLHRN